VCRQNQALHKEVQRLANKLLVGVEQPAAVHARLVTCGLISTEFSPEVHTSKTEVVNDLITLYIDQEDQNMKDADVFAKISSHLQSKAADVRKVLSMDSLQQTLTFLTSAKYQSGILQPFTGKFLTFLESDGHEGFAVEGWSASETMAKFMNLQQHREEILAHFFDEGTGYFILPRHCVAFMNAFIDKELVNNAKAGRRSNNNRQSHGYAKVASSGELL
jgi:hypothetical protein